MSRYRFDVFELDVECARLTGPEGDIRLRAKAFRVLAELLQAAPHIVSSEKLLDRVWGTRHLTRNTVAQTLQEVRNALKASATTELIDNVPRLGYRVLVPVLALAERDSPGFGEPAASAPASSRTSEAANLPLNAPAGSEAVPSADPPSTPAATPAATSPPGVLPRMLLIWPAWRWGALALFCVIGVVLATQLIGRWSTPAGNFRSAADLGIRVEGRGADQIGAAVSHMLARAVERRWGVRPVNLGSIGAQADHAEAATLARDYRVDVWYTANLTLKEAGKQLVLDGQITVGGDHDTSTITIPVRDEPVEQLVALADLVADRLADAGSWNRDGRIGANEHASAQGMLAYTEADVLLSRGQPSAALESLAGLDPSVLAREEFASLRARAFLTQGRVVDAVDALPARSDLPEIELLRARATRQWDAAVAIAKQMYEADPLSARRGLDYVRLLIDSGDLSRALAELDTIATHARSEFDQAEFTILRAGILRDQGEFARTEAMLVPVLERMQDANQSELGLRGRQVLASAVAMQGRWEEALGLHQQIRSDSGQMDLRRIEVMAEYQIADLLRALGRHNEAETTLRLAIERFDTPNTRDQLADLQLGLAYMRLDAGDLDATHRLAEQAAATLAIYRNVQSDAAVAALRSEVAMLRGELNRSIELMKAATEVDRELAAHNEASRRLVRLAFRQWLAGQDAEAERTLVAASTSCAAIGSPQSCGFGVQMLTPNAASNEQRLNAFAERRRGLRELYTTAMALLARDRVREAAALIELGSDLMADAPAHYQAMFALVAALGDARDGQPVRFRHAASAQQFPALQDAADWLGQSRTDQSQQCALADNDIIQAFCRRWSAVPRPPSSAR